MDWKQLDESFVEKYKNALISYYRDYIVPLRMSTKSCITGLEYNPFEVSKNYHVSRDKYDNQVNIWFYNEELDFVDTVLSEKYNSYKKYLDINNFLNWKRESDINVSL